MAAKFVPARNFNDIINDQPGVKRARMEAAEAIAERAASEAPERTGHYRRSLEAVEDDGRIRAQTTDPSGHMIEWGSANNPAYSPIRKAIQALGLRLDPERK